MALIGTLTDGVSALKAFSKDLEVIGNNISNVNTTAFKSSSSSFAEQFSNTLKASTSNSAAMQIGTGVALKSINVNYGQGALSTTGQTTDVGISGNGFLLVSNGTDVYATRVGSLHWDVNGKLVNDQGLFVKGVVGDPTLAASPIGNIAKGTPPVSTTLMSIGIGKDGTVTESYSDGTSAKTGRILLQQFGMPSSLMSAGNGLFSSMANANPLNGLFTAAAAVPANYTPNSGSAGSIEAGTLELSNVDLTQEFANMITAQRSFQANSRLVTVSDTMLEEIVNLKR